MRLGGSVRLFDSSSPIKFGLPGRHRRVRLMPPGIFLRVVVRFPDSGLPCRLPCPGDSRLLGPKCLTLGRFYKLVCADFTLKTVKSQQELSDIHCRRPIYGVCLIGR